MGGDPAEGPRRTGVRGGARPRRGGELEGQSGGLPAEPWRGVAARVPPRPPARPPSLSAGARFPNWEGNGSGRGSGGAHWGGAPSQLRAVRGAGPPLAARALRGRSLCLPGLGPRPSPCAPVRSTPFLHHLPARTPAALEVSEGGELAGWRGESGGPEGGLGSAPPAGHVFFT